MSARRVLGINAVSNQPFWQVPDSLVNAVTERLPDWEIVVARASSELGPMVKRSHAVIGWPFPAVLARGASALAWVHFFTSGVPESWEGIASRAEPPRVTSMRGENAQSVAEHGLLLTMAAVRGLRTGSLCTWRPEAFAVPRAADTLNVAILGCGAIGGRLARLLVPVFREVRVTARARPAELPPLVLFENMANWDALIRSADVLVMALPLTPETRVLFGAEFFRALKDRAILINLARGELVREEDVLAFLARNPESRYATDVVHPEPYPDDGALNTSPQVLITPHIGARREDAWPSIEARTLAVLDAERRMP